MNEYTDYTDDLNELTFSDLGFSRQLQKRLIASGIEDVKSLITVMKTEKYPILITKANITKIKNVFKDLGFNP